MVKLPWIPCENRHSRFWKSTLRLDSSKKPLAGSGDQGPNHKPPHPFLGAVPHVLFANHDQIFQICAALAGMQNILITKYYLNTQ